MPRRKYKADKDYLALKKKSLKGKSILGGCLKAELVSDRAIERIYLHSDEIGLPMIRHDRELYVDPSDVEQWLVSSEGHKWAYPKLGAKA